MRIIIHPWLKGWTNPCTGEDYGFTFPNPTAQEKSNLGAVIDAAYNKGLQVFIVMVLPTEYLYLHPDEIDDVEYAKNNQSLVYNLYTFWNNIFGSVLSARMNKISYVDIMGDFDPLNIWGRFSSQQLEYHREWWRRIWPNFYAWYSYIPSSKKVFELVGGPHNPKNLTRDEINWVRNEINSRGWPEPSRYSIEAYVNRKWLDDNYPNNWYGGYHAIFSTAASAAGGWNKLLIEELGSNHYPGADTNDGAEGDRMFSASMAVIANFAPDVPFGIWNYYDRTAPHDQTHSFMGLYKAGNVLTIGWYVLPLNFCGQVPC